MKTVRVFGVLGFVMAVLSGCVKTKGVSLPIYDNGVQLTSCQPGAVPTSVNFYRQGVKLSQAGDYINSLQYFCLALGAKISGMPTPQIVETEDTGVACGEGRDVEFHYFPHREAGVAAYRWALISYQTPSEVPGILLMAKRYLERSLAGPKPTDRAREHLKLVNDWLSRLTSQSD